MFCTTEPTIGYLPWPFRDKQHRLLPAQAREKPDVSTTATASHQCQTPPPPCAIPSGPQGHPQGSQWLSQIDIIVLIFPHVSVNYSKMNCIYCPSGF